MSKKMTYVVGFYTLKPLPVEMRKTFELKGSPYKNKDALAFLEEYGVVHFRDEMHPSGIVYSPQGVDYTKISPFEVYQYTAKLETDNKTYARISNWASGQTHKKWADKYSWLRWSEKKKIVKLTPAIVHLVK